MKRTLFTAVVTAMLVAAMAVPAMADIPPADAGVFQGTATIGKNAGAAEACTDPLTGPGLGLPIINEPKNAYYRLDTSTLFALWHGQGRLVVCGRLTSAFGGDLVPEIGAACGMSKSDNGKGYIDWFGNGVKTAHRSTISDVEWKFSAGGAFLAIGRINDLGFDGLLAAVVQATGGGTGCVTKVDSQPKQGGAQFFNVVGAFAAVEGLENCADLNTICGMGDNPVTQKCEDCLIYGPKKPTS